MVSVLARELLFSAGKLWKFDVLWWKLQTGSDSLGLSLTISDLIWNSCSLCNEKSPIFLRLEIYQKFHSRLESLELLFRVFLLFLSCQHIYQIWKWHRNKTEIKKAQRKFFGRESNPHWGISRTKSEQEQKKWGTGILALTKFQLGPLSMMSHPLHYIFLLRKVFY